MRHVVPSRTKGAQRKRRLARGVTLWDLDRQLCAEPTRRIACVTLTVAEADPAVAYGWVRDFWARVRKQWLGTRYFCWLELQRRGAVHYHCVWLNPPHVRRVNLLAWVDKAWGHGRTRTTFSDGVRGIEREVGYAVAYSKKMGRKAYQQMYDDVPRQLRTFMSQRLEIPPKVLAEHIDQEQWSFHEGTPPAAASPLTASPGSTQAFYLRYEGVKLHVVSDLRWCSAQLYRRRSRKEKPPPKRGLSKQVAGRVT